MAEPKVLSIAYHRNGIGGQGFVAALVEWPGQHGEMEGMTHNRFVAFGTLPPEGGADGTPVEPRLRRAIFIEGIGVLHTGLLDNPEIGVAFGRNSWRGSDYVGPAIADAWHKRCVEDEHFRYCPFGHCEPDQPVRV